MPAAAKSAQGRLTTIRARRKAGNAAPAINRTFRILAARKLVSGSSKCQAIDVTHAVTRSSVLGVPRIDVSPVSANSRAWLA